MSYPPPPEPPVPPQQGYPQQGYPQQGYPQQGYPQPGWQPYAPPPKRRPSAWWFTPGAVALVLAIGCVVVAIVVGVRMYHTDGYLDADGSAQSFDLGEGGHMLFAEDGIEPPKECTASDGSGPLALEELDISTQSTVSADEYEWYPFARFRSDGSPVTITCTDGEKVRVGAPAGDAQFIALGVSVLGAIGLGILGLAGSILVAVLYFTRKPRSVTG